MDHKMIFSHLKKNVRVANSQKEWEHYRKGNFYTLIGVDFENTLLAQTGQSEEAFSFRLASIRQADKLQKQYPDSYVTIQTYVGHLEEYYQITSTLTSDIVSGGQVVLLTSNRVDRELERLKKRVVELELREMDRTSGVR